MDEKRSPLVILGLDVGDPDDIRRWATQGYLPTIDSIMRRGCWGRTAGTEMLSEQGLWFSMFNGISRGKHGHYYFRQLKPGTYDLESFTGLDTSEKPFWALLPPSTKKVAHIDVPDACPLPGLAGLQLSHWAIHNIQHPPFKPASEPLELLDEVQKIFGRQIIINEKIGGASFNEEMRMKSRFLERIEKKGELCRHLLKRDDFDLFVVVFAETHTASHQFWRHRDRDEGSATDARQEHELAHAIRDIYQAIDKQLGLIIEQLPKDANVVITSASGMEDHYPSIGLIDSFLRRLGYQAAPEPAAAASPSPLNLVRRLVPESLRIAASRHLPRAMQERLTADNFRNGTNWHKTSAFSIPAHYNSFVRANLRGREPLGTVEPGKEYESLIARLEDDLSQLIDPVSGEWPIKEILRSTVFGPNPNVMLPDLFVKWKSCPYFRERLIHPKAELSQPVPGFFRDSEHSDFGFFAAAGPAISGRGDVGDVSLLDMAPTFLTLMNEPVPERMTGSPVEALAGELTT